MSICGRKTTHAADDTIDNHGAQGTVRHAAAHQLTKPFNTSLYPVHRILPEREGRLKHDEQDKEENGESEVAVRQDTVDEVRHTVGILLHSLVVLSFCQRTVYEAVFRVHDGRLGVFLHLFLHTLGSHFLSLEYLVGIWQLTHIVLDGTIVFQELDSQITGRIQGSHLLMFLQVLLDMCNARLYLMAMRDMDMAHCLALVLIYVDDLTEQFLHSPARLEGGGHEGHTEQRAQRLDMYRVAATLKLVIHVQRTDHAHVHID